MLSRRIARDFLASSTDLHVASTSTLTISDPSIDNMLDIPLKPLSKVFEHGRSTREHDVLNIETSVINHSSQ